MSTLDDQPKLLHAAGMTAPEIGAIWSVRPDIKQGPFCRTFLITLLRRSRKSSANAVDALAWAEPAGRPGVAEAHVLGGQVRVRPWTVG